MALRTSTLFAALGGEGALDVAILLLTEPEGSTVGAIVDRVKLSQSTVSRRLEGLEAAGLLAHGRRGQPFALRERDLVADLLLRASELSERLLALDGEAERAFRERVSEAQ